MCAIPGRSRAACFVSNGEKLMNGEHLPAPSIYNSASAAAQPWEKRQHSHGKGGSTAMGKAAAQLGGRAANHTVQLVRCDHWCLNNWHPVHECVSAPMDVGGRAYRQACSHTVLCACLRMCGRACSRAVLCTCVCMCAHTCAHVYARVCVGTYNWAVPSATLDKVHLGTHVSTRVGVAEERAMAERTRA